MSTLYAPQGPIIRPRPLRAAVLEGRIRPLSRRLALDMLAACDVSPLARIEAVVVSDPPTNLDELLARWDGHGPVPVSGEHASDTIWGHPDLNALFRAWHDTLHVLTSSDVDVAGEHRVATAHLRHVDGPAEREILWAETFGQTEYHARHGRFPRLQRAFVVFAVRFGLDLAIKEGERFS